MFPEIMITVIVHRILTTNTAKVNLGGRFYTSPGSSTPVSSKHSVDSSRLEPFKVRKYYSKVVWTSWKRTLCVTKKYDLLFVWTRDEVSFCDRDRGFDERYVCKNFSIGYYLPLITETRTVLFVLSLGISWQKVQSTNVYQYLFFQIMNLLSVF